MYGQWISRREGAVGEQHHGKTLGSSGISHQECFCHTNSRGMSSTAGFAKPQWHSTAHFPHTEKWWKKPGTSECQQTLEKKQAFTCCLSKKRKEKNTKTLFVLSSEGFFFSPLKTLGMFYTVPTSSFKENPVFLQVKCHTVKNGRFPPIYPLINTHTFIHSSQISSANVDQPPVTLDKPNTG